MYCLGKFYNYALIGLETNFSTYPTKELERLGYDYQYVREKEDEYTGKTEEKFGFRTTMITRPLILANLQQIFLEEIDKINDIETLREALTFIKNERGRPEAMEGEHDDLIMGLAITYYIRDQQSFKVAPKERPTAPVDDYSQFDVKSSAMIRDDDFGSEILII